ncbi:hypothetical protein [Candidatus Amarolinea aalborgensis]|jgi:hypothetical protein|uniref:hypothetical protein n=1 Tax=Candidatus Amarolinea aalborgensis TaxID=2249329 RepID=UPI003BFA1398
MPAYHTGSFDPPAPVGVASFVNLGNERQIDNVPMLLDTGADVSFVPESVRQAVEAEKQETAYEIEYLEGRTPSLLASVYLQMKWQGLKFTGSYLVTTASYGVIGRNILNRLVLVLDGPSQQWEIR